MSARFLNEKIFTSTQKYLKIAADDGFEDPATMVTVLSKQFSCVASTIIGATTPEQLDASLAAMGLELSAEVLRACDAVHEEVLYPMG